jgi:thiol-disulfide isomerase/thioredoxin
MFGLGASGTAVYGLEEALVRVLSFSLCAAAASWLAANVALSAEAPGRPATAATLRLADGDYVAGELRDSRRPDVVCWQGTEFTTPFEFALRQVSVIQFPPPAARPKPAGEFCFELSGGDLLFGSLVALSAEEVTLDAPRLGLIHVRRADVRRMLRWREGAEVVYVGPNGLSEWDEGPSRGAWRQEGGHLVTDREGASLAADLGLPVRARVEFEISWSAKPDFTLALGTSGQAGEQALRFEVWDDDLVAIRETDTDADLALLQKLTTGAGRAGFLVYLDQQRNMAAVFSAEGKRLAELSLPHAKAAAGPGVRLVNKRGNVRLERLRIARWDGELPREPEVQRSSIHRLDAAIVYGEIRGFDAAAKQLLVSERGIESRIDLGQVSSVVWSSSPDSPRAKVRAVLQDGRRLSGDVVRVAGGRLWLARPGVTETLPFPVSELQTLLFLGNDGPSSNAAGRLGRLEMDGAGLNGWLVDGSSQAGASCLIWQPRGSSTASPLRAGVSARIVYREPPRPSPQQPTARAIPAPPQAGGVLGQLAAALGGSAPPPVATRPTSTLGPSLHLRTGDTFPCQVERIDERGVTLRSSMIAATFVPHGKIKAVELENRSRGVRINPPKRDRLLTLPRMQKENPPTHLIRSVHGDYLRARLIAMDDKTLTVEVRLETRQLPREQVSGIIWLHEDELGPPNKTTASSGSSPAAHVQALRADGIRLTFVPDRLVDATLCGASDVLGACRVELGQIDQLLVAGGVELAARELAYQRWRLQHAPEPRFVSENGRQGELAPGTESALVGQAAPDFELDLLGGGRFRLREQRGKTVVLDFWATWCGPCIQTMPQVHRVVQELQGRKVELVAVNLQEEPAAIAATLERLKLTVPVALDRDGVVAEKYAAVAIPQTVIIDADGNVARLFVGGGPQFAEQLRTALADLVTGPHRDAAPK